MLQRERRNPVRRSVNVSKETEAALQAAAERYGIAPGVLARWAIETGLPAVRDRLRKQGRKAERREGDE